MILFCFIPIIFSFFVLQTCRQLTPDWCTIILPKKASLVLVTPQTIRSPQVLPDTTLSVPSHFATCFRDGGIKFIHGGKDGWDGKPKKDGWVTEIYLDHLKQAVLPSNRLISDRELVILPEEKAEHGVAAGQHDHHSTVHSLFVLLSPLLVVI